MIDFPESTRVNKRIPKEAFYQRLPLTANLKAKFISDVDSIIVSNSLKKENLHLAKDSKVREIMLLTIKLKKQNFDGKILEAIARQNSHKLIFLLVYEGLRQLAVYRGRLYVSRWMDESEVSLSLSGSTLDDIWDDLVRQTAISSQALLEQNDREIDEQLKDQNEINRLNKLIQKTEAAAWKEQQPKKRFELYTAVYSF